MARPPRQRIPSYRDFRNLMTTLRTTLLASRAAACLAAK